MACTPPPRASFYPGKPLKGYKFSGFFINQNMLDKLRDFTDYLMVIMLRKHISAYELMLGTLNVENTSPSHPTYFFLQFNHNRKQFQIQSTAFNFKVNNFNLAGILILATHTWIWCELAPLAIACMLSVWCWCLLSSNVVVLPPSCTPSLSRWRCARKERSRSWAAIEFCRALCVGSVETVPR